MWSLLISKQIILQIAVIDLVTYSVDQLKWSNPFYMLTDRFCVDFGERCLTFMSLIKKIKPGYGLLSVYMWKLSSPSHEICNPEPAYNTYGGRQLMYLCNCKRKLELSCSDTYLFYNFIKHYTISLTTHIYRGNLKKQNGNYLKHLHNHWDGREGTDDTDFTFVSKKLQTK